MNKLREFAERFVEWTQTPFGVDVCIFLTGVIVGALIAS